VQSVPLTTPTANTANHYKKLRNSQSAVLSEVYCCVVLTNKSILGGDFERQTPCGVDFAAYIESKSNTCLLAINSIGMIARNISNSDSDGMLIIYKTLVRPVVDYCIPVWRTNATKDITKLEKIQKRFTKMSDGCKKLSYEQRLLILYLLETEYTRVTKLNFFDSF